MHTLAFWTGFGLPTNGVPSYIVAQGFERYSHKSGTAESGLNVSHLQIYLECAFDAARNEAYAVTTFIHMDYELIIELATGQAVTKY